MVAQLVKKFFVFYGTQSLITVFTQLTTRPYSELDESSPHPQILFPLTYILILYSFYAKVSQTVPNI
jgi:hypothetical protein